MKIQLLKWKHWIVNKKIARLPGKVHKVRSIEKHILAKKFTFTLYYLGRTILCELTRSTAYLKIRFLSSCPTFYFRFSGTHRIQIILHILLLKGAVAWEFWSWVFHQTTPPGPIRDILEPFSFLTIFHGVIKVLKRLPGVT